MRCHHKAASFQFQKQYLWPINNSCRVASTRISLVPSPRNALRFLSTWPHLLPHRQQPPLVKIQEIHIQNKEPNKMTRHVWRWYYTLFSVLKLCNGMLTSRKHDLRVHWSWYNWRPWETEQIIGIWLFTMHFTWNGGPITNQWNRQPTPSSPRIGSLPLPLSHAFA